MTKKSNSHQSTYLNSEKAQLWATVAMCSLFIGVGIPVWWKTTEVYRAVLPYDAVTSLSSEKLLPIKISIQLVNVVPKFDSSTFATDLKLQLDKKDADSMVDVLYNVEHYNEKKFESLGLETPINNLKVVFQLKEVEDFVIQVTNKRVIFCFLRKSIIADENTLKSLQESLSTLLKDVIINEKSMSEVVSVSYGNTVQSANDNLSKAVKTNPNFELLFSLLCPEPEEVLAEWDIKEAVLLYFNPMMDKLKRVFNFHVGSQILYYTKISYLLKLHQVNTSFYYITQNQLSHVINPIEAKLGSQLSSNPTLNFAVYVIEKHQTPLYIKKKDNSFSQTNSFLVPRWGAMMLYNIENVEDAIATHETLHHKIDMKRVFGSFLEHFRTLVGVPSFAGYSLSQNVVFDRPNNDGVTDWELDSLMRLRALENTASSVHTLDSLLKLLHQIRNIVINDDIAEEVYTAVNALQKAKHFSQSGNLSDFLRSSKQAFVASEKAFFDPTLLELLYFPEDQKFAIYIPLFLPISLPLLVSILKQMKRYKEKKKLKSD